MWGVAFLRHDLPANGIRAAVELLQRIEDHPGLFVAAVKCRTDLTAAFLKGFEFIVATDQSWRRLAGGRGFEPHPV